MSVNNSNAPYVSPSPGKIPIIANTPFSHYKKVIVAGASGSGDNRLPVQKEDVKYLEECGFNVCMESIGPYVSDLEAFLDLFEGTDIGFMPACSLLNEAKGIEFVKYFKNRSHLVGWDYKDEPHYSQLEDIQAQYNLLRKADANGLFYINLIGAPIEKFIGPFEESQKEVAYKEYLEKIQEMFSPALWSYDLYPIRNNGKDSIYLQTNRFYLDFEYFSELAKKTNRPFWAYCQSQAFYNNETLDGCPPPKEAYLRYEAFSALAYGAQGIVYWTYGLRKSNDIETYTTALYAPEKRGDKEEIIRTEYWYYAQKVNREIEKYTFVFLNCELVKCLHIGKGYLATAMIITNFGPLNYGHSEHDGAIVSHIKKGQNDYLAIVNHSPLKRSELELGFKADYKISMWGPDSPVSGINSVDLSNPPTDKIKIILPPGGYMIIPFRKNPIFIPV